MKKGIALFILSIFLIQCNVYADDVLRGHAEYDDEYTELDNKIYTGKVETLDRHDTIEMTVSQVLDGNFSLEGDEFFAEITKDVYGDKGVVIPKGSVAHGVIRGTGEAKRLGRDGYIDLSFDNIVTPDGREIPIDGKMSTKLHPLKAATKIVATDIGYTAVGGAVGGFFALQTFGIEAAIASQGWTVAGGAAAGGAVGLGMSLYRKGKDVLISPGDEIRVKVLTSVELPVYREEALQQEEQSYPGIEIAINNIAYEKDPFGEANTITLSIAITNMSDRTFSGMDLALISDYNTIYKASIFGDTRLIFSQFKPGERKAGKISFAVDNVKHSYWLAVNDRAKNKPLIKVSLDNAYKKVPEKVKKRNDRIKKPKKNYYKEDDVLDYDI